MRAIWRSPTGVSRMRMRLASRLAEHVFLNLAEARETIEAWRHDYNHLNHLRPHRSPTCRRTGT